MHENPDAPIDENPDVALDKKPSKKRRCNNAARARTPALAIRRLKVCLQQHVRSAVNNIVCMHNTVEQKGHLSERKRAAFES
ncbi:hypothetical protein OKW41_001752 [Paraburkholderia sp. UCT70]|uniref:hypothetical protein n=1 Tax=Paraburkholderia sp. UCT70 TaxID=2991068 RepID=UPI003D238103